jgi:hypothetical protein
MFAVAAFGAASVKAPTVGIVQSIRSLDLGKHKTRRSHLQISAAEPLLYGGPILRFFDASLACIYHVDSFSWRDVPARF